MPTIGTAVNPTTVDDAKAKRDLYASHRQPGWMGLGSTFDHEVTDHLEMLSLWGGDNWNLRLEPVPTPDDVKRITPLFDVYADIQGETRILGTTGKRYHLFSNEQAFAGLQSFNDGGVWETAGAFKQGRVVFGTMRWETSDIVLDPNGAADKIQSYLMFSTSHDGSSSLVGGITPVRVKCWNTLLMALSDLKEKFSIRHTASAEDRMKQVAAMFRGAHVYMDAFEAEAQALYQTSVTDKKFWEIVETVFPEPEEDVKGSLKKWETKRELHAQAWNHETNANIRNTAWGVANVLTEVNQWGRGIQKTESGQENFWAAGAGFDAATNDFRTEVFALAKTLVKA